MFARARVRVHVCMRARVGTTPPPAAATRQGTTHRQACSSPRAQEQVAEYQKIVQELGDEDREVRREVLSVCSTCFSVVGLLGLNFPTWTLCVRLQYTH